MKKNIVWLIQEFKSFGVQVTIYALLNKIYKYGVHQNRVAYKINCLKHKSIRKALRKKYKTIIEQFSNIEESQTCEESKYKQYIWTIWWQGEENAPDALKMCYKSMRKFSNGHQVVVLSKDNYQQYADIPQYIMDKVEVGKISFIHFADILRMYLLYHYGGMWLDATIFLTKPIDVTIFEWDYYTGKLERQPMACVSEGRWNGTFFAGKPRNVFFDFMITFYYKYWEQEEQEIDYFLIDYMTDIAYEDIPTFKKQLDAVPINNECIFKMNHFLNSKFEATIFNEIIENTSFHKLQRRDVYRTYDEEGNLTFYGYLLLYMK